MAADHHSVVTRRPRGSPSRRLARIGGLAVAGALALAGAGAGSDLQRAGASPRAGSCPPGSGAWRVGVAKADITPTVWPVAEAAYGIGRLAVGAAHPFFARSVAIQSCTNGQVLVLTALDSQGYFVAYKEDPGPGSAGFGTAAIRATVQHDTGLPASNLVIATTHTHNSPDSVGVWGGGTTANNKAPYLSRVKNQTVASIESAVRALRPAQLRVGTADVSALLGTYPQVSRDPKDYPTDHTLRVLQATDAHSCAPIATLVNAGIHADVAGPIEGPHGQLIDPDWPGRVASDLEAALPGDGAVVMAGAVGRTGPSFPSGTDPASKDQLVEVRAYGDVLTRRVETALAGSQPVAAGPIQVTEAHLQEEVAEPALVALFASESGVPGQAGGVMRSVLPPYSAGAVLDADLQTIRLGALLLAGTPGEAYPEVATELARRVTAPAPAFALGLANDQLGYTPPAFEYPVVALADGGDEGIFTINAHFGDDVINQHLSAAAALGFPTRLAYDGATAGPVTPPDQQNPPPPPPNPPEPPEQPLALGCGPPGVSSPTPFGGAAIDLPDNSHCVSRRRFVIHLLRRRGVRVLRARVRVNGRPVQVRFHGRTRATVNLRGLPRGTFRVRVLLRIRDGGRTRSMHLTRTYHTCARRRHGRRSAHPLTSVPSAPHRR